MKTEKKAEKSFMLKVAHEMAKGLYDAGIMDATTMREFDALCLPPVERLSSEQIKKIRLRIRLSQSVFAKYLNTTSATDRNLLAVIYRGTWLSIAPLPYWVRADRQIFYDSSSKICVISLSTSRS